MLHEYFFTLFGNVHFQCFQGVGEKTYTLYITIIISLQLANVLDQTVFPFEMYATYVVCSLGHLEMWLLIV